MIDKQLKAMMDKKGLTLEKLSMLSNVPIETIRNIIYRRARNPRVDTLLACLLYTSPSPRDTR